MIRRISGIQVDVSESNGFDRSPALEEADWQQMKEDNIRSAQELAMIVREVPDSRLPEPILPDYSSTYKNLQGTVEHVHYHLGQIMLLKKLMRVLQSSRETEIYE